MMVELPATWMAELEVAGRESGMRMRGCGVLVVNPPWKCDEVVREIVEELGMLLRQGAGARGRVEWEKK